ncbi:MAG: hypothetical protein IJI39_08155 [Clostridia bacterium]|nr:hypothetical protein [Clostridia bacterium]MBQ6530876.1 hypothetical protein [Clostridia bacterium]MBQ9600308.1 hypothetical protein [Clostridia bacterium]
MFNKLRKNKEKAMKAKETAMQTKDEVMQEISDEELGEVNGAGNPFASHPRVSSQKISSKVRNDG